MTPQQLIRNKAKITVINIVSKFGLFESTLARLTAIIMLCQNSISTAQQHKRLTGNKIKEDSVQYGPGSMIERGRLLSLTNMASIVKGRQLNSDNSWKIAHRTRTNNKAPSATPRAHQGRI